MREIKFRAWDEEKKEMWSWEELCGTGKNSPHAHPLTCLHSGAGWWIMQYTGLRDKNGKEIYEGDIVKNKKLSEDSVIYFGHPFCCGFIAKVLNEILQDDELPPWYVLTAETQNELIVIGNIYENPDWNVEIKNERT